MIRKGVCLSSSRRWCACAGVGCREHERKDNSASRHHHHHSITPYSTHNQLTHFYTQTPFTRTGKMSFFRAGRRGLLSLGSVPVVGLAVAAEQQQHQQEQHHPATRCDAAAADAGGMSVEMPALVKQAAEERRKAAQLKNPGSFEKIIEEGKRLSSVDCFEGFRLEIQKMVTPHFYMAHLFMLGVKLPHVDTSALYDFSTHVVLPGNQLLMARLGHGGSMDGRFHFGLGEKTLVKMIASLQPNPAKDTFQMDAEHHGTDHSLTFRMTKGPQVYASYLQSITPSLALGGDTLFDFSEGGGVFSLGGKYNGKDWTGVAMLAQYGQICLLQYIKHVSPGRMALVADLVVNPLTLDSQTVLGAEVNMKQSRFVTTVDNGGKISALLESRVVPNAVTLLLSGEVDHAKDEYKFGYGFQLNL